MSVEVVLRPGNQAGLTSLLNNLYTKGSAQYGKWLAAGQFQREFAPSAANLAAIRTYLASRGLSVGSTSSSFLLRAAGTSAQIEAAFGTAIDNYRSANGTSFFSNTRSASLPARWLPACWALSVSPTPSGCSRWRRPPNRDATAAAAPSCEVPYPKTLKQLKKITAPGQPFNGYGGGPGCSGLTPAQTNSLYNAPNAGPTAQGRGATVAVFELSAYTRSDITTWAQTFYGSAYTPPVKNINVDGGPTTPGDCPTGDTCVYGYGGDDEVEADIEEELSIAPDVHRLLVYNAPNDFTGQTSLDEYTRIANQDSADSVSSSWGECEPDAGQSYAEAENIIFEQMAAQGQSMFAASGDTGAFECIRDGTFDNWPPLEQLDPGTQPWVTSVGGTSFESFDPGNNPNPNYPNGRRGGVEHARPLQRIDNRDLELRRVRRWWRRPQHLLADAAYQQGPGVINADTVSGTANCALATKHEACREVPTSRQTAIHSPGTRSTAPDRTSTFPRTTRRGSRTRAPASPSGHPPLGAPGWFHIGGTSLDAPLMAAVFADRDAFNGVRTGNANEQLYALFNTPHSYSLVLPRHHRVEPGEQQQRPLPGDPEL